jgi:hypothetical protein
MINETRIFIASGYISLLDRPPQSWEASADWVTYPKKFNTRKEAMTFIRSEKKRWEKVRKRPYRYCLREEIHRVHFNDQA